ncbi:MAG: permease prefix domain 1-containing protein [Eubacteriales bacterium]|nr:permease prefix domain 1-containing protein [Eubacteriales bacterium]
MQDMQEKIRQEIKGRFADGPKTRRMLELKEEIIANAIDKYEDMLSAGHDPQDAYEVVIHSIGNVEELFEGEQEEHKASQLQLGMEHRKKRARLTAISVGIYIIALITFLVFAMLEEAGYSIGNGKIELSFVGLILMFLISIPPTVMLVYSAMVNPSEKEEEKSFVRAYQEKEAEMSREKSQLALISSIFWTAIVAAYLLISFRTGAWAVTWVIFLIGSCVDGIIRLWFSMKHK